MITSFFAAAKPGSAGSRATRSVEKPSEKRAVEVAKETQQGHNKRAKVDGNTDAPTDGGLLSHLTDESWLTALEPFTKTTKFSKLASFVEAQHSSTTIYPPLPQTFNALNSCPLGEVKVVIVGQDPYHGPNQAHGLSFSVRPGNNIPPSLRNMYKELNNDAAVPFHMPNHGHLQKWTSQGVLLLNSVMSVPQGQPNAHKKKAGWEDFTNAVIGKVLSRKESKGVVFLLWGKPAAEKATKIIGSSARKENVVVITTSHPSPLGATKTSSPFMGSKCFSRANEALLEMGLEAIDWNV